MCLQFAEPKERRCEYCGSRAFIAESSPPAGEKLVGPCSTLFMDEISTGLDSSTTYLIVKCMRNFVHMAQVRLLAPTLLKLRALSVSWASLDRREDELDAGCSGSAGKFRHLAVHVAGNCADGAPTAGARGIRPL